MNKCEKCRETLHGDCKSRTFEEWLIQVIQNTDENWSHHSPGTLNYMAWSIEWQTLKRVLKVFEQYKINEEG